MTRPGIERLTVVKDDFTGFSDLVRDANPAPPVEREKGRALCESDGAGVDISKSSLRVR